MDSTVCHKATELKTWTLVALVIVAMWTAGAASAQMLPDWRRVGNAAIDLSLGSLGTGPVNRVWYSPDGSRLFARNPSGSVFETTDFETWRPSMDSAPPADTQAAPARRLPESAARLRSQPGSGARLYAFGRFAYKSDDGGAEWSNLTAYRDASIIGEGLADLAVSPRSDEEVVVANRNGVWRSVDAGLSWSGLNQALPNLPVRRLVSLPGSGIGVRLLLDGGTLPEIQWTPGERHAWRPAPNTEMLREASLRVALSQTLGTVVRSVAMAGDYVYVGSEDGTLRGSADRGKTWQQFSLPDSGPIERIFIDPKEPRLALAAVGMRQADRVVFRNRGPHVLRTFNNGLFWDDLTANLPETAVHGIAADRASGAIYIASDLGVFSSQADLLGAGTSASWSLINGKLPLAPAMDVRLDSEGNQLYAALDGYGVFATVAPHRARDPRLVNAADFSSRPAAPGSVLTLLGGKVQTASTAGLNAPVLAASDSESQIQVPFEAKGQTLTLALEAASGHFSLAVPLQSASPAILIDRDGSPLLIDGESGMVLDSKVGTQANSRVQLLATGLGKVTPDWPAGLAPPLENPPQVAGTVKAFLDGMPVQVMRAGLAPGYPGFYLVELQLPRIVNAGLSDLFIDVDGHPSNRIMLELQQ